MHGGASGDGPSGVLWLGIPADDLCDGRREADAWGASAVGVLRQALAGCGSRRPPILPGLSAASIAMRIGQRPTRATFAARRWASDVLQTVPASRALRNGLAAGRTVPGCMEVLAEVFPAGSVGPV